MYEKNTQLAMDKNVFSYVQLSLVSIELTLIKTPPLLSSRSKLDNLSDKHLPRFHILANFLKIKNRWNL